MQEFRFESDQARVEAARSFTDGVLLPLLRESPTSTTQDVSVLIGKYGTSVGVELSTVALLEVLTDKIVTAESSNVLHQNPELMTAFYRVKEMKLSPGDIERTISALQDYPLLLAVFLENMSDEELGGLLSTYEDL